MAEITDSRIKKNSILLARNTPVALVVGVEGFLGSNLAEGLIKKGIQVVGVDNFSSGKKENLEDLRLELIALLAVNAAGLREDSSL